MSILIARTICRQKLIAYLYNKILMNHKVELFDYKRYTSCPFLSVVCKLDALESSKLTARFRKSYAMFVY